MSYLITWEFLNEFFRPPLFFCFIFSLWGGMVCYLLNRCFRAIAVIQFPLFSQLIISTFLGTLAGVFCQNIASSESVIQIVSGLAGAIGSNLLYWLWKCWFPLRKPY